MNPKTLAKALRELVQWGFISKQTRAGRTNRYDSLPSTQWISPTDRIGVPTPEENPPHFVADLSQGGTEVPTPKESDKGISHKEIPKGSPTFDDFWICYGKDVGRKSCERKWKALSELQRNLAFEALPAYVASTPNLLYRKNPLTWLSGECWNDDLDCIADQSNNQGRGRRYSRAEALSKWERAGWPGVLSDTHERQFRDSMFTVDSEGGETYFCLKR